MTQPLLSELSPAKRALREACLRGRSRAAPIAPRAQAGDAPLSHAQERLWFLDRMYPGVTVFNLVAPLRLPGALDEAVLERALAEVVRRHDALRTTFREVNGAPVQVVAPFTGFALPAEDLSGLPPGAREAQVRARVARERAHLFDLSAGPLFRASLLRLDAGDHVLLVGMHHIVGDAWSMGVFLREIHALYDAYREGWDSPLTPLPVQYADYAAWQRAQPLAAEERHLAYWRRQLGGAPELLELPTDRPRTPVPSFRGAQVPVEAPLGVLDRLRALANAQGATLHMVLLGAFQLLLARYAGTLDVSVGIAVAGRSRREIEGLIGILVNTLVLRTDLSGDPTFRAVVERVRETALDAYQHQEVPFERVVAEVRPQRSLSHSALYQVLFLLDELAPASPSAPAPVGAGGLRLESLGSEQLESTQVDLTLVLRPNARGLSGWLEYATDLFDEGTARRMAGHLERVLALVAADPDARLSGVELLDESERRRILERWSGAEAVPPREGLLHVPIAAQAARTPDAVAVVFEDESLTYRALEARATRLAHHLVRLGAGPEARVGVCLQRGPEMMVAVLAVLKAGAAYLPLDPGDPAERRAYMLEDAGAPLVVTRSSLRGLLAGEGARIVLVDGDEDGIAAEAAGAPRSSVVPENAAYVIYTSGSTGRPKGVVVTHANAVSLLAGMDDPVGAAVPGTWLAVSRLSFDAHVTELLWTLARGFRVVIHPEPERARAERGALARRIRRHAVTHLQCTPSLLRMLLAESGVEGLAGVERLFLGAEPLPPDLVRELGAVVSGGVVNLYGPTETTVWATAHEVERVAGRIPIGSALAGARVYVLDGALRPQPVGVPGELCIAGPGVARGYLNRPGMTAERFVPDPFASVPGARMYRSGDRVRWVEGAPARECVGVPDPREAERTDAPAHPRTAVLDFLGRMDAQVKIRGFRIEPGEIEAVLSAHVGVRVARVIVREDAPDEKRLVAYVVGDVEANALREHLRGSLPEYMVPAAFVPLEALPLTPNGKLDRKALPAPEYAAEVDRYVAPRTPVEEVLGGIWAELLGRGRVGAEASFFDLGGHSLLATRLTAHVRQVFGVELPLRAVFERPVLSGLAAEIERLRGTGAAAGEGAIAPATREGDLPVTFAQERLWFVDALDPGSPVYAIPFSYRITGRLDPDALRRALAELVRRHEPLRTTLPAVCGVPVQRIAPPPAGFDLPVADLRQLPEDERRAEAGRLAAEASRHRFDLARGPLFRASLIHVADDEHLLLLNLHHAIGDGWSLGVLLDELSALYGAFSRGEPSPLPEPALQYADYAVWQRERLSGSALERQVEFWRQALDGAPALLELPADRPRPPVESHRGALERLVVSPELAAEVNALARREGATLFMVLLAALDVVLGRLAGQEDVVVGAPIAGRTRAETDRMVGLFLNSLALRTDLSGDPSFRELLGRVRESTLAAYAHQELPFERVLEEVRPERSLAHAPVFQVMLNLLNFEHGAFRGDGLEVAGAGSGGEPASKFDLTLYVGEGGGGIDVSLVYAADLFDAPRMRGLLAQLEGVLRQAAAAPETRVGALSLATEAARGILPDPARPIEAEAWRGAVHETFAAHAAQSPEAPAISAAAGTWTYAELDAAANRIAHRLIDGGVRPGEVVAVYAHRSAPLIRALLGTWKAGAAFAVLDPAYPPARLAAQAGASRPVALLRISAAGEVPAEVAAALAGTVRTTVVLSAGRDDGLGGASAAPAVSVAADDLAYVAFTSGTTGTPKAIAGTHRPLAHFFGWYARELGIGEADRVSLLSGLAHDPLLRDVFAPLATGGRIVIPDPDPIGTPGWLAGWMRDEGITVAHLTPAMGQLLATGSGDVRLPALRLACFGGDVLRAGEVERLRALAPDAKAVNFYGATETPQAVGCFRLPADLAEVGPAIPVGRGIDGVDLLVVTPSGTLAGIGERGEIAVRTPYLSRGYLNDAELTAARFVANPLTGDPADRVYRTGDLARWRPDGTIEFLGRTDLQVKVRGFRIEPGEIEARLAEHPGVREAVVMAREDVPGDVRLVAYLVGDADAESLRAHLSTALPEYMVPAAYVRLEALPLTPNGKPDRKALPAPEHAADTDRYVAPRKPVEEVLAGIWAKVLRRERVGVHDSFFDLGGHSLLIMRLLANIQATFDLEISIRTVFSMPTLEAMAGEIERRIYEDVATMSEFEAEQLAESNPVVGADETSHTISAD